MCRPTFPRPPDEAKISLQDIHAPLLQLAIQSWAFGSVGIGMSQSEKKRNRKFFPFPSPEILFLTAIIAAAVAFAVVQGNVIRQHRADYSSHRDSK